MAKRKRTKKRKVGGRTPKLRKPSQRSVVLRALRQGMTMEDACLEAGASYDCLKRERRSDEKFKKEVETAIVVSKRRLIKNWGEKKPDTLAAIRWPDQYGRKDRFTLQQIVELHDEWLEGTLTFVPEERHEAFKDMLNAKLTRVAIKAGVLPPENA